MALLASPGKGSGTERRGRLLGRQRAAPAEELTLRQAQAAASLRGQFWPAGCRAFPGAAPGCGTAASLGRPLGFLSARAAGPPLAGVAPASCQPPERSAARGRRQPRRAPGAAAVSGAARGGLPGCGQSAVPRKGGAPPASAARRGRDGRLPACLAPPRGSVPGAPHDSEPAAAAVEAAEPPSTASEVRTDFPGGAERATAHSVAGSSAAFRGGAGRGGDSCRPEPPAPDPPSVQCRRGAPCCPSCTSADQPSANAADGTFPMLVPRVMRLQLGARATQTTWAALRENGSKATRPSPAVALRNPFALQPPPPPPPP